MQRFIDLIFAIFIQPQHSEEFAPRPYKIDFEAFFSEVIPIGILYLCALLPFVIYIISTPFTSEFLDQLKFPVDRLMEHNIDNSLQTAVNEITQQHLSSIINNSTEDLPSGSVLSVAFSPDGKQMAGAYADGTVKIWDMSSRGEWITINGHSQTVWDIAYSPDGTQLVSGSADGSVKAWDTATGEQLFDTNEHNDAVLSVAYSPDGKQIASGSVNGIVKLWNATSGEEQRTLVGHGETILSVTFSPNGRQLASGSADATVKIWDVNSGIELYTLLGHHLSVMSVAYNPDGNQLATGSWDRTVKIWDTNTGIELDSINSDVERIWSVAYSPNGKRLAVGSADGTIKEWDTETRTELRSLIGHSHSVFSVAYSPNGSEIASGSDDNTIKIWNAENSRSYSLVGHSRSVFSVAYSPDSSQLASGSDDNTVKIWNTETGEEIYSLTGHSRSVFSVVYSPNGTQLASGSSDNTIKIWDSETSNELLNLARHKGFVRSLAYNSDGSSLASGSSDHTIKIWNTNTGAELRSLVGHDGVVLSVIYSPDDSKIASGSLDNTIKIWDVNTGEELRSLTGHDGAVRSVVFSPDGSQLASASSDNTIKIWDVESGELSHTFVGHNKTVLSVAFSPDGSQLASGSLDNTIKLWDAQSGEMLRDYRWHNGAVLSVVYSSDGTQLASGSSDNTIRIWTSEVYTLGSHNGGSSTFTGLFNDEFFNKVGLSLDTYLDLSNLSNSQLTHMQGIATNGNFSIVDTSANDLVQQTSFSTRSLFYQAGLNYGILALLLGVGAGFFHRTLGFAVILLYGLLGTVDPELLNYVNFSAFVDHSSWMQLRVVLVLIGVLVIPIATTTLYYKVIINGSYKRFFYRAKQLAAAGIGISIVMATLLVLTAFNFNNVFPFLLPPAMTLEQTSSLNPALVFVIAFILLTFLFDHNQVSFVVIGAMALVFILSLTLGLMDGLTLESVVGIVVLGVLGLAISYWINPLRWVFSQLLMIFVPESESNINRIIAIGDMHQWSRYPKHYIEILIEIGVSEDDFRSHKTAFQRSRNQYILRQIRHAKILADVPTQFASDRFKEDFGGPLFSQPFKNENIKRVIPKPIVDALSAEKETIISAHEKLQAIDLDSDKSSTGQEIKRLVEPVVNEIEETFLAQLKKATTLEKLAETRFLSSNTQTTINCLASIVGEANPGRKLIKLRKLLPELTIKREDKLLKHLKPYFDCVYELSQQAANATVDIAVETIVEARSVQILLDNITCIDDEVAISASFSALSALDDHDNYYSATVAIDNFLDWLDKAQPYPFELVPEFKEPVRDWLQAYFDKMLTEIQTQLTITNDPSEQIKTLSNALNSEFKKSDYYRLLGTTSQTNLRADDLITISRVLREVSVYDTSSATTYLSKLQSYVKHKILSISVQSLGQLSDMYWQQQTRIEEHIDTLAIIDNLTHGEAPSTYVDAIRKYQSTLIEVLESIQLQDQYLTSDEIAVYDLLNEMTRILRRLKSVSLYTDSFVNEIEQYRQRLPKVRPHYREISERILRGSELSEPSNAIHDFVVKVESVIDRILQLHVWMIRALESELTEVIANIAILEDFEKLDQSLANYREITINPVANRTIEMLLAVQQEISAAMAQPKDSYQRRLAIQEAHIVLKQLNAYLTNATTEESKVWLENIKQQADLFNDKSISIDANRTGEPGSFTYSSVYVTGNKIKTSNTDLFKGRRDVVAKIVDRLRASDKPSFLVYGARRMGKSSLLSHLPNLLPHNYIPVYFDAQKGSSVTDSRFFFYIARAIYMTLRKHGIDIGPQPDVNRYDTDPFVEFNIWLEDTIQPVMENKLILLMIDEFEQIAHAVESGAMSEASLNQLRFLMQDDESGLVMIFAGVQAKNTMHEAIGEKASSVFISVLDIEISFLDTHSARELIVNPNANAKGKVPPYSLEAVERIIYLTHCQPYLIQALCSELVDIANQQQLSMVESDHVDLATQKLFMVYEDYFINIWNDAKSDGQALLMQLVKGKHIIKETSENRFTLYGLKNRHVIAEYDKEKYFIEIPLVEDWIRIRQLGVVDI